MSDRIVIVPTEGNGYASLRTWHDPHVDVIVLDVTEPDAGEHATFALTESEAHGLIEALYASLHDRRVNNG